ncbi:MAG: hypothetical protein LBJ64_09030, partial [Deltaproteobacteria bacterium]|nr:hypothetical protein [Deltaproteobacteria bacterium]
LLDKTEQLLKKMKQRVESGNLQRKRDICVEAGRIVERCKMEKYFDFEAADSSFDYSRKTCNIKNEELLDGLYAVRASASEDDMSADDCARGHASLTQAEDAFRSIKTSYLTTDLPARSISRQADGRVKTHFLIGLLAYYVVWHMKEVWREMTFSDEKTEETEEREPVEPAQGSALASRKAVKGQNEDGDDIPSFSHVLERLSTHVQIEEKLMLKGESPIRFASTSVLTSFQRKALELLGNVAP